MQKGVDQVSDSCDSYDLAVGVGGAGVVCRPAPGRPCGGPTVAVEGQRLQVVDKFTYFGSTLSRVVHIGGGVGAGIAKASAAYGRLRASIWDRGGIRLDAGLEVYGLVVLPTLLYACETWTVFQRRAKGLNNFHTSCLRKRLKIKWQDGVPGAGVLWGVGGGAGMQSVHTLLKLAQLRWTGHVTRMPDERLPKKILYGELQVGKRSHGGRMGRCGGAIRASLKDFNIPSELWGRIAQDHTKWRGLVEVGGGGSCWVRGRQSAWSSRGVHIGKPEIRHHQQNFLPQTSLVLSTAGGLELRLVSSAILEHTNNNTSHSWLGLVIVSNDRRTTF